MPRGNGFTASSGASLLFGSRKTRSADLSSSELSKLIAGIEDNWEPAVKKIMVNESHAGPNWDAFLEQTARAITFGKTPEMWRDSLFRKRHYADFQALTKKRLAERSFDFGLDNLNDALVEMGIEIAETDLLKGEPDLAISFAHDEGMFPMILGALNKPSIDEKMRFDFAKAVVASVLSSEDYDMTTLVPLLYSLQETKASDNYVFSGGARDSSFKYQYKVHLKRGNQRACDAPGTHSSNVNYYAHEWPMPLPEGTWNTLVTPKTLFTGRDHYNKVFSRCDECAKLNHPQEKPQQLFDKTMLEQGIAKAAKGLGLSFTEPKKWDRWKASQYQGKLKATVTKEIKTLVANKWVEDAKQDPKAFWKFALGDQYSDQDFPKLTLSMAKKLARHGSSKEPNLSCYKIQQESREMLRKK